MHKGSAYKIVAISSLINIPNYFYEHLLIR